MRYRCFSQMFFSNVYFVFGTAVIPRLLKQRYPRIILEIIFFILIFEPKGAVFFVLFSTWAGLRTLLVFRSRLFKVKY